MKGRTACIFSLCVLIGIGIVVQSELTDGQKLYVSQSAVEECRTNLETLQQEIERIGEIAKETQEKIDLYRQEMQSEDTEAMEKTLSAELLQYKMFSGGQSVHGPGVEITINDGSRPLYEGEDINNVLVHDSDILMVVNELKRSGAEAIAVNGQRIVNTTEIVCAGYTIRINGITYARPFVITAIGDASRMSAALLDEVGYGTTLKDYGVIFEIEIKSDIVIEGYSGEFENKYLEPVKGGEKN